MDELIPLPMSEANGRMYKSINKNILKKCRLLKIIKDKIKKYAIFNK